MIIMNDIREEQMSKTLRRISRLVVGLKPGDWGDRDCIVSIIQTAFDK